MLLVAAALAVLLAEFAPAARAQESEADAEALEVVELNGQPFPVPPPWRGHRIDDVADPGDLVALPSELTGELGIHVTKATRTALVAMAAAAEDDGLHLQVDSGFRSFGFQKRILEGRLAKGRAFSNAVRWTAPPGYSEHVTGRAVDFVPSDADFRDSPAYRWLRQRAAEFCFVESYPFGNPDGFEWEPWHWRHEACSD